MIPPRKTLAAGDGWSVLDVVCTAGPSAPSVEERFDAVNIALVMAGTFRYRCAQGDATLVPGGVMLGNVEACFECGHEHSVGDRCLALHFAPETFEEIVAATPGVSAIDFKPASLPPLQAMTPVLAAAGSALDDGDAHALEALAFAAASKIAALAAGELTSSVSPPTAADRRRVSEVVQRLEETLGEPHSLESLAREAGMSRYHFLRVFRTVTGAPPHQYLLHRRLLHAALRLMKTDEPVSAIAYDAGFNDLSTFNRRFRKIMGASPTQFRARR